MNDNDDKKTNINNFAKISEQLKDYSKYSALSKVLEQQSKSMTNAFLSSSYINSLTSSNSVFKSIDLSPIVSQLNKTAFNYDNLGISKVVSGLSESISELMKTIDISSVISTLNESLNSIRKVLSGIDFSSLSKLSGLDSEMLKKYYWVIPFEYKYEKVRNLSKYKNRTDFEKYMLKYFNDNRIKRMLNKIKKSCVSKDKKELIKQVEHSFFIGDYAICITSLITMLDGLTLQLIAPNSDRQHLSYKAINDMLEYINDSPVTEFSYELYLKVDILNNFYLRLYNDEENLKTANKRLLSRHLNSRGVKYINRKIEVLRLLNAIYFCQLIIDETELQEQFTRTKKAKKFVRVLNESNNDDNKL